jgi:hypothetical protein
MKKKIKRLIIINLMFERPVLIYSDYCIHSTNFINELMKNKELFESFIRLNIDVDANTRSRPSVFYEIQEKLSYKITEIPTIIVENAEYILTGVNAFEWLEYTIKQQEEKEKELVAFNPIEMGSFSDSYSSYGCTDLNDAKEQCFKFLNKSDEKINTPQELASNVSKDEYSNKQKERENFDNTYNQNSNQHLPVQRQQQHQPPQFDPKYLHGSMTEKQKDFDIKLQQMVLDRERSQGVKTPKMNPDFIDFKTGNIKTN